MSENHLKQISLIIFGIIALLAIVGVILLFAEESITGDASRLARAAEKNKARQAQQRALQQVAPVITPPRQTPVATQQQTPCVLGQPGCETIQQAARGTRQVIFDSSSIPTQASCSSQGMQYNSALHNCYSPPPTQQTGQDCPPGMKKAQVGGPADFFCIASP